jgi:hypothetical protein
MFNFFFNIWKKFNPLRCCFCNGTDKEGKILYETDFILYSWHYHQRCLTDVVCFPEKHPDKITMAGRLAAHIKEREERKEKELNYLKSLQKDYCIEGEQP